MRQRRDVPAQHGSGEGNRRGERLLMLATLEDGIRTILQAADGRTDAKRVADDVAWLTSDDRLPPFSFLNLCDFLGIEPDYLRARVLSAYMRRVLPTRRVSSRPALAARAVQPRPLRRRRPCRGMGRGLDLPTRLTGGRGNQTVHRHGRRRSQR